MIGLPTTWQTARFVVQNVALEESGRLREVYNSCNYVQPWDKTFYLVSEEEIRELVGKSLAFGGTPEDRFQMQAIRRRETGEIIGYFHLTHGRPKPHIAFISMFVVAADYQKDKVASEVAAGLWEQLRQAGECTVVWLEVFLKNWPALRFWINNGFTTIIDYEGAAVMSEEAYASMVLEKGL